ncbi:MAG: CvpA family protein [Pseudomonadota bacterium]
MPITLLDGILIVIMLISAILAMIRGFSREVLSIVSWVVAALAALYFHQPVAQFLASNISQIPDNELVQKGIAAALVFLIVLIVVSYLTMLLADFIIDSRIGVLDRTLGFIFGAARGALLVIIGLTGFLWLANEQEPAWVKDAKSKPMLVSIGNGIRDALPDNLDKIIKGMLSPEANDKKEGEQDAEQKT